MISIFILTHNEERDIAACIESALGVSDDVIVVDSFSCDRTLAIAQKYPIRTVQHTFESHGKQRTWMLCNVPTQHPWVYILEADERMTPELFNECVAATQSGQHVGYYVAERVMFMNRWIRYSTQYPRYQLRLLDKQQVWFDDYGHTEREVCDGSTGFLRATYPHYTCSKGFARWLEKHNRYSSDEAAETINQLSDHGVNWRALFLGRSEVERRRALKDLSLRLPLRPLVRFIYMYFFLGGILDGRAGFTWCMLQAFYEYLITLKVWELQHGYTTDTSPSVDSAASVKQTAEELARSV
ncbi:glycosyltransferase family 2 protein [Leptolyngbya cf. ectocarpi LEGE 11479]|uniref:Glycosyltransferase family 2 protein n=1 Tax=Leptolyngbya cf. ectocarpi LEGE 11479 TaxID=1828722 RepID=A0A929F9X8_LEPEC|nr:glycosyltransferase family 2 protein [Leptolyngbya ectocarpi]MBE9070085.1 glycosyltransferase family 2 protein [Leptolyngbya cf. ectocarpi LEGE 11479]